MITKQELIQKIKTETVRFHADKDIITISQFPDGPVMHVNGVETPIRQLENYTYFNMPHSWGTSYGTVEYDFGGEYNFSSPTSLFYMEAEHPDPCDWRCEKRLFNSNGDLLLSNKDDFQIIDYHDFEELTSNCSGRMDQEGGGYSTESEDGKEVIIKVYEINFTNNVGWKKLYKALDDKELLNAR